MQLLRMKMDMAPKVRTHKFFFKKAKNQFLHAKWIKQVSCQVFHPCERGELLQRRQGDVLESLF